MTDQTQGLRGILEKMKDGAAKLNQAAKDKADGKRPGNPTLEIDDLTGPEPELSETPDTKDQQARERRVIEEPSLGSANDDPEDALIIEGESELVQKKRGFAAMSIKQKGLLCVLLLGAAFVGKTYIDNQANNPLKLEGTPPIEEASPTPEFNTPELNGNTNPESATTDEQAKPGSLDFGVENLTASNVDDSEIDAAFGPGGVDQGDKLDPFTGNLVSADNGAALGTPPNTSAPAAPASAAGAVVPAAIQPASANVAANTHEQAELSPFGAPASNAPELSGSENQNTDSGKGDLLDPSATANVAPIAAKMAEKDRQLAQAKSELEKVEKKLAESEAKLKAAQAHKPAAKPQQAKAGSTHHAQTAKATTQKPSPRTAQQQRVATTAKAPARPQLCVSAVAQAARNCTTCVPHAFVKHKGVDTMVGQGDYVEGLRVNIVGDRLDLQNSQGDVVHKFWSSLNGCAG
jgi:hypothetical protein